MSGRSFEPGGNPRGEFTVAAFEQRRGAGRQHRHRSDVLYGKMAKDVPGTTVMQGIGTILTRRMGAAIVAGHFVHCMRVLPVGRMPVVRFNCGHLGRHAARRLPAKTGREHGQQQDQDKEAGKQHGHGNKL